MYALLSQNKNYIFEKKNDVKMRFEKTKADNLNQEIMKKKERLSNFDPDAIFNMSEESCVDEEEIHKHMYSFSNSIESNRYLDSFASAQEKAQGKGNIVVRKIFFYKKLMKSLDIISTVLLIIGTVIALIENQQFYENNLEKRITAIKIVNCIIKKDFSSYNSTLVDQVMNVTDYLSTINKNDISSINVDLTIDSSCKNQRLLILACTGISIFLLISSRWCDYVRNIIYIDKSEVDFYKTNLFWIMIFEVILALPAPYPGVKGYLLYRELGSPILIPFSSIFTVFSLLRVYFLLKLFKHLTRWSSSFSEYICEKYVCKANTSFAFKAFQKEYPFFMLSFIFIISCYCFGAAVKTFELHYWENFDHTEYLYQNWNYQWNAMWFVFVSMTTVGYGDFTPKTQFGRVITIFACLVGVYFVSMMMVFMTDKTQKSEREDKAFRLITRLKYRDCNKELYGHLIHNFFETIVIKNKKKNEQIDDKEFDMSYKYKKRISINFIQEIKENIKKIKFCEFIPTKEQLLDISEKLDSDIKAIKNELLCLKAINESIKNYTDDQLEIVDYLKKNMYAVGLFFELAHKSEKFPKLKNVKKPKILQIITEMSNHTFKQANRRMTNPHPQQFEEGLERIEEEDDVSLKGEKEENDLLAECVYNEEKIKMYFEFLYAKKRSNRYVKRPSKSKMLLTHILRKQSSRDSNRRKMIKKAQSKIRNEVSEFKIVDDKSPSPKSSSNSERSKE